MSCGKRDQANNPHAQHASEAPRAPTDRRSSNNLSLNALLQAVEAFAGQAGLLRWRVCHRRTARGEWVIVLVIET
jgi:hypothetical protein